MRLQDAVFRHGITEDLPALETLYSAAFPDEDLLPLVRQLVDHRQDVISLIAEAANEVVAHIAFTDCRVDGQSARVALLGPAAVMPGWQGRGLGDRLIRDGIAHVQAAGFARVLVLGDPAYYSRFGFAADDEVTPPHKLPEEWRSAWQSIKLLAAPLSGTLLVPEPWRPAALWQP